MSTNHIFGVRTGANLASSLVVLVSALAGKGVLAQDAVNNTSQDDIPTVEEIIVQGTRLSLENAQDIKREADTFVDAISASDIGALPDRSVLEALQRVPGISIERFAASSDPDHFGVEGSSAVVRGMTQTRSEFNGRDSFTANSGRGLSFQDVPPELMKTVKVFKNQTADMIEGGIAGTVSLFTRLPFDSEDMQISFSGDFTYGDMAEKTTPTYSGLFSNRWDTDAGEFGILVNYADSHLEATSHGIQTDRYELRGLDDVVISNSQTIPGFDIANPYLYDGSFGRGVVDRQPRTYPNGDTLFCVDPATANAGLGANDNKCTNQGILIPIGSNMSMKNDIRYRTGLAVAAQWKSPDETLLASIQFLRSDATLAWNENSIKSQMDYNDATQWNQTVEDADYGYDDEGTFTHGLLTNIATGWRGGNRAPDKAKYFGLRFVTDTRYQELNTLVEDTSFNIVWTPSDQFELEADVQYIDAATKEDSYTLMYGTYMNQTYDVRGKTPSLTIHNPWSLVETEEKNTFLTDGGQAWWTADDYFSQLSSYVNYAASDHLERSNGKSTAAKIDATYYLEDSIITKVKAGLRRSEREQIVRNSTYNWAALEPFWQNNGGWLDEDGYTETVIDYENYRSINRTQAVDWSDFYRGGVVDFDGDTQVTLHPSLDFVKAYSSWANNFAGETLGDCTDWRPLAGRIDQEAFDADGNCANQLRSDLNGAFLDQEITDSSEINNAFYVRADFEFDGAMRIAGNFGVRVVSIETESAGNTVYPDLRPGRRAPSGFNPYTFNPLDRTLYPNPETDLPYDLYDDSSKFLGDVNNFIPQEWKDFANGVSSENYAAQRYTKTLPSFNLKVELTPDLIGRFAVSKAIALPDIGDMRNYTNISASGLQNSVLQPVFTADYPHSGSTSTSNGNPVDGDGNPESQQSIVDVNSVALGDWVAEAGNPFLQPMESTQFDLSLEWYFGRSNSITGGIFYKDLNNFFFKGAVLRNFTNPSTGATETVTVTSRMNGGAGEMKGFEINYQQFFDMLPEPFDGLGTQLNYSYIQASGIPNPGVPDDAVGFVDGTDGALSTGSGEIGLEGQSEHTANAILMYQKAGFDARIAYNWRSEYLLTSYDVISRMPVYNDDAGFMDASIFYNITDQIKIGLQGVNLLNTQTKTFQLVDDTHKLGRSWFVNDRRYSLVLRATF